MAMTEERFEYRPLEYVIVLEPTLICVGIVRREDFDRIDARLGDSGEQPHGNLLTKVVRTTVLLSPLAETLGCAWLACP